MYARIHPVYHERCAQYSSRYIIYIVLPRDLRALVSSVLAILAPCPLVIMLRRLWRLKVVSTRATTTLYPSRYKRRYRAEGHARVVPRSRVDACVPWRILIKRSINEIKKKRQKKIGEKGEIGANTRIPATVHFWSSIGCTSSWVARGR